MADLRAILTAHGEDYDKDCMIHFGCTCGAVVVDEEYWEDGKFEANRTAWIEHVVEVAHG